MYLYAVNELVATYPTKTQNIEHAQTEYRSNEVALLLMCKVHKTVDPVERVVAAWR